MSTKKKVIIGVIVVAVLGAVTFFSLRAGRKDAVPVETGKVERKTELIALVSATGEIMPKEYVELQAEISGVITDLYVKEGDRVEKGDLLLRIDPVQTETELKAQRAVLDATESEARNQLSQISVQETNVDRDLSSVRVAEAELDKATQLYAISQATFDRKQELFEDNLLSRDAYELAKNDVVTTAAALKTAQMRLDQAKAQHRVSEMLLEQSKSSYESAQSRVRQQRAFLDRSQDLLAKTLIRSPLAGVITQMNVERGERAVPGTLNNPLATLMIIADLSVIEAELEVDETDIVDLVLGQSAIIKVDALPDTPLKGTVTEIGNSAIQQTSGQQEAKDFKVVVQLTEPPKSLRPGLSCTGEITTATRQNVIAIPIQALTIREFPVDEKGELIRPKKEPSDSSAEASSEDSKLEKKEWEGVFRVEEGKSVFIPVKTGIVGDTEIEILSGVDEGETIVTGSFKTLRTLSDGDPVKVETRERG